MQGPLAKATDVSPWYGVDTSGFMLLHLQGEWILPVKFGTSILIVRHTIVLFWGLTPSLESMTIAKKIQAPSPKATFLI